MYEYDEYDEYIYSYSDYDIDSINRINEYRRFVEANFKERVYILHSHSIYGDKYFRGSFDEERRRVTIDTINPFTGEKIDARVATPKVRISHGDNVIVKLAIMNDLSKTRPEGAFACIVVAAETAGIEELDFSPRLIKYLKKSGYFTVGELIQKNGDEILKVVNDEPMLLKEIKMKLNKWG